MGARSITARASRSSLTVSCVPLYGAVKAASEPLLYALHQVGVGRISGGQGVDDRCPHSIVLPLADVDALLVLRMPRQYPLLHDLAPRLFLRVCQEAKVLRAERRFGEKIWALSQGAAQRLLSSPPAYGFMVTRHEHGRRRPVSIRSGPGVLWELDQTGGMGIVPNGCGVPHYSRNQRARSHPPTPSPGSPRRSARSPLCLSRGPQGDPLPVRPRPRSGRKSG